MTYIIKVKKKLEKKTRLYAIFCLILACLMLLHGQELRDAIFSGMSLAATNIIPTLFPFMILSDLWASITNSNSRSVVSKTFERVFKINGAALTALICGMFAGFPLGVKSAAALYRAKAISKQELERLAPMVNLPSPAFVISGIGIGLFHDIKYGILLYLSVLLSSLATGLISKAKCTNSPKSDIISRQNFVLSDSIRDAAYASLAISAYIVFFSGVIGLLSSFVQNKEILAIISTLLEIGNSSVMLAKCPSFSQEVAAILTAFALGFSGMSVHMQAFAFLPSEISKAKYLLRKFLIGIISSLIFALSLHFI